MGGTMRLGADPVKLHDGTRIRELYGEPVVYERHRHRYEVNNHLRRRLEAAGLICSGTSPDERLVEAIELARDVHPFFVASQYHPEFKSRPETARAAVPGVRRRRPRARRLGRRRARAAGNGRCRGRAAGTGRYQGRAAGNGRYQGRARHQRLARRRVGSQTSGREAVQRNRARPAARHVRGTVPRSRARRGHERAVRGPGQRRAALAGARGARGRRGRARRRRRRQPAGADSRAVAVEHPDLRPPRHRAAGRPGRAGARRRLLVQRQRGDPRSRQQVGGRGRARARPKAASAPEPPAVGVELLFTVCEEVSLRGSREFDVSQLRSAFGYVFDHATPIGEIVVASPTHYRIEAEFRGQRRPRRRAAGGRPQRDRGARRRRSPRCASAGSTPRRPPTSA